MTAGVKMNRTDKLIRIGVIADTHGLFDPEIIRYFKGVDHIIHAGDIGSRSVIECLEGIAPVTAVSGNVDEFETSGWPRESMFIHDGVRVAVRHVLYERGRLTKDAEVWLNRTRPAVCVFGHSHRPTIGRYGQTVLFNPGSAGPQRFSLPRGIGILTISKKKILPRLIRLGDKRRKPKRVPTEGGSVRRTLITTAMWLLILCNQPMLALGIPNPDTGPGCGLGKKLWSGSKNQKNIMPQVFMATTNVTGFQTFAISSGTSGCSNDGVVWADHKVHTFVTASYDDLVQDMAQGRGEHLASLAALMGVEPGDEGEFFARVQQEHRPFVEAGSEFLYEWLRLLHQDMNQQKLFAVYSHGR